MPLRARMRAMLESIPGGRLLLGQYRAHRSRRAARVLASQLEDSRQQRQPVAAWWNQAHAHRGTRGFWLTGSSPDEVWNRLGITQRIEAGARVLNIGVGTGRCTRALFEAGCETYALDVSEVALENVRSCTSGRWNPDDLRHLPSDYFDLAISHLVAQHMSDVDLVDQLTHVIRSLKADDGLFAMQFAYRLDDERRPPDDSDHQCKAGGVCRGLLHMSGLVHGAGGTITWHEKVGEFRRTGSGWYAIHIRKKDDPNPGPHVAGGHPGDGSETRQGRLS